jgi:hypothetical protein
MCIRDRTGAESTTRPPLKYLLEQFPDAIFRHMTVARRGIMQLAQGQGADGYGRAIKMDYEVLVRDRWRRVLCCCISNVGSVYVPVDGEWHFIRDGDIPDHVRYPKRG